MHESFDTLTREIARSRSRREALKALGRGLVTLFVASLGGRTMSAADIDQAACRQRCGKTCTTVTNGQVRTDFACVRACATQCTPSSCPPGNPDLCGGDPVTLDSMDAAREAIANGVNEGPLSPNGCVRYRQEVDSSGQVTSQAILHAGMTVFVWNHTPTQSTGARDIDLNGCPDWRATARYGTTINDDKAVFEDLVDASGKTLARQTYTRTDDVIHVVLEEVDDAGTLQVVDAFDTDLYEDNELGSDSSIVPASVTTSGCNADQAQRLKDRLRDGIGTGLTCMQHFKNGAVETTMTWNYTFRDIVIRCAPLPTNVAARVSNRSFYNPKSTIEISVNQARFFTDLSDYEQGKTLWHEMLHLHFGPHNKNAKRNLSRYDEFDQVTACEDLCFGPADVTKCKCARCLKTDKCDPRCQIYQECDSALGYQCPCPRGRNAFRYFNTCTQCLTTCPSGLACFGFSRCKVVSTGCSSEAPKTCP